MTVEYQKNVSLADHTTFHVGGAASHFSCVTSVAQMREVLEKAKVETWATLVLGGGSNVLIADEGFDGLVIKNDIKGIESSEGAEVVGVTVGSGEVFDELVAHTVAKGWWGLENLSHIPGTVGATPIQNVGAYGVEIGSLVKSVVAIHKETGEEKEFSSAACQFGYRDSFFKTKEGRSWVVLTVSFLLTTTATPQLEYKDLNHLAGMPGVTGSSIREAVIAIRSQKFPDWTKVGTAGSFFKNPIISAEHATELAIQYPGLPQYPTGSGLVKVPLGWILDKVCELKNAAIGPVRCYEKQALVIVAESDATAGDIIFFAKHVAASVKEKTNIDIEWEVTCI